MNIMNIWIWVHHREGILEEATLGLAAEACRFIAETGVDGTVTAIAMGNNFEIPLEQMGQYGVNRVIHLKGGRADSFNGEYFSGILERILEKESPFAFLMAHTDLTADMAPRLAALNDSGVLTRAVDLNLDNTGAVTATRLIANGHLSETLRFNGPPPYLMTFIPSVLNSPELLDRETADVVIEDLTDDTAVKMKTNVVAVIEAAPGDLDIEEADIVVAGGRGAGKDKRFEIIHQLAAEIGGSVAGTRPVIDSQTLPHARQIGQTGKTVTPQLIINCGISGANEYTAGMEKSRKVIAINVDPKARIFRFADLGVVGDLHQVLPVFIERLREVKAGRKNNHEDTKQKSHENV